MTVSVKPIKKGAQVWWKKFKGCVRGGGSGAKRGMVIYDPPNEDEGVGQWWNS